MSNVTKILSEIESGDAKPAEQLLPLVYDELRKLAAQKMVCEDPGQTLQATALVHEAYLRLVNGEMAQRWNSRWHFFGAAAEAMRRILVEAARRRRSLKRGGDRSRHSVLEADLIVEPLGDDVIALDEALDKLADVDRQAAELVKLRYFAGLTTDEAAATLSISARTAKRTWTYAKAWLRRALDPEESQTPSP